MSNLASPLALFIYEALRARRLLDFDCIVPIPLSPDKRRAGEIDRTSLLAAELAEMLNCKVVPLLSLSRPISKHRLRTWAGLTTIQFEWEYRNALEVQSQASRFNRVLLLDDVCTEGSTLRCAASVVHEKSPDCEIFAASAGQMIVKAVVMDDRSVSA